MSERLREYPLYQYVHGFHGLGARHLDEAGALAPQADLGPGLRLDVLQEQTLEHTTTIGHHSRNLHLC